MKRPIFALSAFAILFTVAGCDSKSKTETSASGSSASATPNPEALLPPQKPVSLMNVSYDPTRELYAEFNQSFADYWKEKNNQVVTINQSHGGSGSQARAVIEGLEADVVTLALGYDIDAIVEKSQLIDAGWQEKLPHNSSPYTSTIVFLVRKGNPKKINDWSDLVKDGVEVITPNPKTGGGARWNYLAAWGFILKRELGDLSKVADPANASAVEAAHLKAEQFIGELFKHVPVLDKSARDATTTFVQKELGDVLLTWENEAHLAAGQLGPDKVEIVVPSISILAEPPVAVVTKNAKRHGTEAVSQAYLEYLYSPAGQQLAAKHFYRAVDESQLSESQKSQFAKLELFKINDVFGGWAKAQKTHFADGGTFDRIYQPGSK